MKKYKRQFRLCAIIALSALILGGQMSANTFADPPALTNEIRNNIKSSPEPTKVRMFGAAIFSISILTAIIVVSREIKLAQPKRQKILSKYYRS